MTQADLCRGSCGGCDSPPRVFKTSMLCQESSTHDVPHFAVHEHGNAGCRFPENPWPESTRKTAPAPKTSPKLVAKATTKQAKSLGAREFDSLFTVLARARIQCLRAGKTSPRKNIPSASPKRGIHQMWEYFLHVRSQIRSSAREKKCQFLDPASPFAYKISS